MVGSAVAPARRRVVRVVTSSQASYALDVTSLEEADVTPIVELRPAPSRAASGPKLVAPKRHSFGEVGQHLQRVGRKVDWPVVGGDID